MRFATILAAAAIVCSGAGCAEGAQPPARAELAFAAPEDSALACGPNGPSHVSVLHPPVRERLRAAAERDAAEDGPVRAWSTGDGVAWVGGGAQHRLFADAPDAFVTHVSARQVDARRVIVAWTEGTVERGYRVRLLTVGLDGQILGPPATIADDLGGVIGRPEVTFRAGSGAIVYLASTQTEFRLVETPLRCSVQ